MASSCRRCSEHSCAYSPSPPGAPRMGCLSEDLLLTLGWETARHSRFHALLQSQGSESLLWGCRALVSWSSGRALLSPLHIIPGDMWPRASHATAARSPSPAPYAPRNSGFMHPVPLTSPLGCPKGLVELLITPDESCFPESSPWPTHSTAPSAQCLHPAVLAACSPFPPTLTHWHVLFGP